LGILKSVIRNTAMIRNENLYQSILKHLSLVSAEHLPQIDQYLHTLIRDARLREQNRAQILELAGAWQEMPEAEFQEVLNAARNAGIDR
jgi:hypothetical protein